VPHIVARNIASEGALSDALARLSGEAGVDRVLLLGGDRDQPAGPFGAALEVLRTGLLEKHAIRGAAFACYPERHPRIADDVLRQALVDKLTAARQAGIAASLVSQFAFDPAPIVEMARKLRSEGVTAPLRIGLAGPVNHAKLLRYALRSGVGPSLRILRDRKDLAFNLLAGETPDALVDEISAAQAAEPMLGISGIHLFTFGALPKSAQWARGKQRA
jgi:methylenetetrahydrofolate reductase (NADPH)